VFTQQASRTRLSWNGETFAFMAAWRAPDPPELANAQARDLTRCREEREGQRGVSTDGGMTVNGLLMQTSRQCLSCNFGNPLRSWRLGVSLICLSSPTPTRRISPNAAKSAKASDGCSRSRLLGRACHGIGKPLRSWRLGVRLISSAANAHAQDLTLCVHGVLA
jgi:hypothetical protein